MLGLKLNYVSKRGHRTYDWIDAMEAAVEDVDK